MELKLQNINFSDKIPRLCVSQSHERMRAASCHRNYPSVSESVSQVFKFKLVGILRAHQAGMVWREDTDWINTTLAYKLDLNILSTQNPIFSNIFHLLNLF